MARACSVAAAKTAHANPSFLPGVIRLPTLTSSITKAAFKTPSARGSILSHLPTSYPSPYSKSSRPLVLRHMT
jgi:hypothetical protein